MASILDALKTGGLGSAANVFGSTYKSTPSAPSYSITNALKTGTTANAYLGSNANIPQPQPQQSSGGGGDWRSLPGYAGWDPKAAEEDFRATGGAGKGGGGGLDDLRQRQLDAINAEFQSEMSRLAGLESTTRSNYESATNTLTERYPGIESQIKGEQDLRLQQLADTETERKLESQSAIRKVKQLLNDLQQKQQAYLSATGGFSSSTSDALGEQFGRQAFSSLADVQNQRDVALREVQNQRTQAQQFYSNKLIEAKQNYENQLASLQQQLQSQLDTINNARGQAESAKRAASVEAWQSYTNAKINLDQQLRAYQDSLDMWSLQMQAQLAAAQNYQLGEIPGLDTSNIFANLQGAIGSIGQASSSIPSLISRVTGIQDEDELTQYLAGLNRSNVAGLQV